MDLSNGVNADQQKYLGKQFEKTLKPTEAQAEAAVRVLLEYIGEDPLREGLQETPARVVRAWSEYCVGYSSDPVTILKKTFEES